MPDNEKRAALIAEGMTEGEADFMLSGGAKADGLDAATPPVAAEAPAADTAKDAAKPTADAAPAAAAVEEDDPEPPKDSPFYRQWHQEKRRRQSLQTELKARDDRLAETNNQLTSMQERWARIDERLRVFREAADQSQETKPPAKPDREADPFAYMAWLEEQLNAIGPKLEQVTSQVQERDAGQALRESYVADARTFARSAPDFGQAYNWLMANRDAELAAAGYADPAERMRIMALDERDIVARSLQARQGNPSAPGPAQIIYNLAKARGFTAPAAAANGANGAAPAVVAPRETVTQQVENIQRGQAASRSLSSGGGSPVSQAIDLQRLADMSDGEYGEWLRTLTPAQRSEYHALIGAR